MESAGLPRRGPANAPITIVEISDFQCPFCARAQDAMSKLAKQYPADIQFRFVNFPLPLHKDAINASRPPCALVSKGGFSTCMIDLFQGQAALLTADLTKLRGTHTVGHGKV